MSEKRCELKGCNNPLQPWASRFCSRTCYHKFLSEATKEKALKKTTAQSAITDKDVEQWKAAQIHDHVACDRCLQKYARYHMYMYSFLVLGWVTTSLLSIYVLNSG